jgi:predicted glycosyltransferase
VKKFSDKKPQVKIALYCHNRDGLGHIMLSIRIAEQLLATGIFKPVLLTGCRSLDSIKITEGIEVHRLTPIPGDLYSPDQFRIIEERIAQIGAFIESFSPDILLVDTLPLGFKNELKQFLTQTSQSGGGPAWVLGSPYPPPGFENIFKSPGDRRAFSAYNFGMIYNDETPDPAYDKISFPLKNVGIVAGPPPPLPNLSSNTILVTAGGGTWSPGLLDPVITATAHYREQGVLVKFIVGPLANFAALAARAGNVKNLELIASSTIEEALEDARIVIARCGYNTAATLARTQLPIIFVPYCADETEEQFTRAQNLALMKNIVMINPLEGDVAPKLEMAIQEMINIKPEPRQDPFSFMGGQRAASYLTEVARQLFS